MSIVSKAVLFCKSVQETTTYLSFSWATVMFYILIGDLHLDGGIVTSETLKEHLERHRYVPAGVTK